MKNHFLEAIRGLAVGTVTIQCPGLLRLHVLPPDVVYLATSERWRVRQPSRCLPGAGARRGMPDT
jgi:hypothetical protein